MTKMGRPRTFDRQKAIEQALHLFWEQGYESTSLSQLKAQIGNGITAPSFYAAFGSKEQLFQEVVQFYIQSYSKVTDSLWDDNLSPKEAIEQTLRRSTQMQCELGHPKGCMVALGIMSAPTAENIHIAQPLTDARARTLKGFTRCVQRGVDAGYLLENTNVQALSNTFCSFLFGISISARDDAELSVLNDAITELMKLWTLAEKS
ncbi:TetR/AcrR family transcriptional regulator [Acinetobacter sichuanensis]|uniref:TetR/AcrR family transcriptional regulator n=1 Tax=Acinetobacter sichuanensis TaxID=2136183 RepID=A0A371YPN6_9GAMM|nr:TetR/AcrR family transcriptional regulator [Acinetobacter sichuanensis]MDQ9021855.1 TetR/AcrR family transcriptional regulator [Acinetobacter sichuanensis]RFC83445.1 TetR/AcrR family transcriptional regulator [Acinetobacter sichuanensis]